MVLNGVLFFYFDEPATEGGHWAFIDKNIPEEELKKHGFWAGFRMLESGNYLKIFDKEDPKKVIWGGTVNLKSLRSYTKNFPAYNPVNNKVELKWINHEPVGVDLNNWAKWFCEGYPAELTVNF